MFGFIKRESKTVADNDVFVTLLLLAKEDKEIRNQLAAILAQPPFHRKSLLNSLISEMKMNSAPAEDVNAIACLLDDAVATKTQELLGQ
jgi:hypothetical protein